MSFGIGLGAFVDGVDAGMNMRSKYDKGKRERKIENERQQINTETKEAFGKAVDAGQISPEQYSEFWMKYAQPKIKMSMLEAGDYAGARAFDEWGRSDAAIEGGRLSASAMLKSQTGDVDGALADGIKSAQTQGYLEHSYKFLGSTPVNDENGVRKGTTLKVRTADGKEIEQFVKVGDEGKIIGMITAPQNAWNLSQAERKAREKAESDRADKALKRRNDIEDYEIKKGIDQKYPKAKSPADHEKQYGDARKARQENDLSWDSKSPEEQESLIRQDLDAGERYAQSRTGQSQAPSGAQSEKRVIVDTKTGKTVPANRQSSDNKAASKGGRLQPQRRSIAPQPDPELLEKAKEQPFGLGISGPI